MAVLLCSLISSQIAPAWAAGPAVNPHDWPHWRGPEQNGISRARNLPDRWSPDGENLKWKRDDLGGRSTPIVMNGKLYTLIRHNPATLEEAEKVICVNLQTGETIWENVFNVFLSDVPDTRVGWSSVVGDPASGTVVALGVCGLLQCINAETGATVWSRSMSEEWGMLTTYGGRTNFPIVFENLVIISGVLTGWDEMARPAHRVIAFDKRNGQCVWTQSTRPLPEDTTYSTPLIAVIDGQTQLIFGGGDGSMYGLQPRTGKIIWNYDVSPRGINTMPAIAGSTVICGHSEENLDDTRMGALFAVNAGLTGNITKTGELWRNKEQFIGKAAPLIVNDRVYAVDDGGILFVADLKTGQLVTKTKLGTIGRASPVYGDGKIYCADATGRWYIFEPTESGLKKLHTLRLDVEINGSPIIAHGSIVLPTETAMYCIGRPDWTPAADPMPELPAETPVDKSAPPATLLVTPAEVLVTPQEAQRLSVLAYNATGQFLRTIDPAEVKWTVTGPGSVDASGRFSSAEPAAHVAAFVTAESAGLKATTRVRIVPSLPWSLAFDDALVPVTGIGMRYRHVGLDYDFLLALRQQSPMAAKLYIYLTSQFVNLGRPALKFDDSTPAQGWTVFRRYLGILESATTQELAAEALQAPLELLKQEGVLAEFSWTGDEKVGAQLSVKKGPRGVQGNGVMCKITTIPKGTRSQGWFGQTSLSNYVIAADVLGAKIETVTPEPNSKMPDIGLLNQRYRFEMLGASQQLKLYSWYPHDQKYHAVPFPWQPETWYRLKFQVTIEQRDGREVAVLQGKAWKRDEPEPGEWSIEWIDSPVNRSGSPGLAGNAKEAEIFFDNVTVTPR